MQHARTLKWFKVDVGRRSVWKSFEGRLIDHREFVARAPLDLAQSKGNTSARSIYVHVEVHCKRRRARTVSV